MTASKASRVRSSSPSGRTAAPIQDLALFPPLVPLLVSVAVAIQLSRSLGLHRWPPNAVFGTLVAVPLAQYVVMGPARLDGYRVLSIVVPFTAVWLAALLLRLVVAGRASSVAAGAFGRPARVAAAFAAVVLVAEVVGTAWSASNDAPRYLNSAISGTDRMLAAADSVRDEQLGDLGLPILANPDLGKVSFAKRAIIIDLGLLGDPLLTRVVDDRNDLMPIFVERVADPDVVEVFEVSPSADLARPMLRRGPGWADDAFDAFDAFVEVVGGS